MPITAFALKFTINRGQRVEEQQLAFVITSQRLLVGGRNREGLLTKAKQLNQIAASNYGEVIINFLAEARIRLLEAFIEDTGEFNSLFREIERCFCRESSHYIYDRVFKPKRMNLQGRCSIMRLELRYVSKFVQFHFPRNESRPNVTACLRKQTQAVGAFTPCPCSARRQEDVSFLGFVEDSAPAEFTCIFIPSISNVIEHF